jgi:hypothetical protein
VSLRELTAWLAQSKHECARLGRIVRKRRLDRVQPAAQRRTHNHLPARTRAHARMHKFTARARAYTHAHAGIHTHTHAHTHTHTHRWRSSAWQASVGARRSARR